MLREAASLKVWPQVIDPPESTTLTTELQSCESKDEDGEERVWQQGRVEQIPASFGTELQHPTSFTLTTQRFFAVQAESSVLRTQMVELSNRLQSLNDILHCLKAKHRTSSGPMITDNFINPWNLMRMNQPIMASAENMFQY
ncbi:ocs element-binding factor 1 [Musa troglodytarum]|uniref:Ocs element-binding factor 1 n=1 Tax=Musa troglodytarum TaxID=320322 RepID=A0A9E7EEZ0_9LILI|nr:ocs element-binding factor 1 [Musa troglodytarum]